MADSWVTWRISMARSNLAARSVEQKKSLFKIALLNERKSD